MLGILWLNNGLGMFTEGPQILTTRVTYDVHLIDVDYDGDLDALFVVGINKL